MKVQVRTNHETSVKWINILCISAGLMVGIIMVTPYLPGKETAQTPSQAAVRFSLGDDNTDGTVTAHQRAPIVQRNVDTLRTNGLRYQQPETDLRSNNSAAAPRTLDPSKDPIITTVPKAPIITSSEAIALKNEKEAEDEVQLSLRDDNTDGAVTARQRAPIVQRNVDTLRTNGLRYQQPETDLRSNNSAAAPRTLDPSKDPIISTVPKAPIITSSEAMALKNQREAEEEVQTTKAAEQKTAVLADSAEQDFSSNDKSSNEPKSKGLVTSQDPNKAIPKQSGIALPEFDFSAIELSAIELPTIELPELAKVFEFGSEQISLPTESNEPKLDADAIVRQHLRKQYSITNGPVQPDMDLVAKGNLPAINYPNQQLPGLAKNMALVRGLNANAAIIDTNSAADGIAGQLTRDINMGSSFVPTPTRLKHERIPTTPETVEQEQIVAVQTSPMNDAEASTEKLSSTEIPQQAEKPQSEKLISNGKSSSGFSFPKFEFPVIKLPEMSLPEFELPSFELPQTSLPECCSSPVKQALSEHPSKPATPAVAVEQKPAPIVSKAEKAIPASGAIFSP